jgi:hypothetical protein
VKEEGGRGSVRFFFSNICKRVVIRTWIKKVHAKAQKLTI